LRFYQAHVQVPGLYKVMGATLGPAPLPVIGFNNDVAWTHTVSTGRRFTLFELTLSGTNYVVDGVSKPITPRRVTVDVLTGGTIVPQSRTFYATEYGPMIVSAQLGAAWSATKGYALRDANIDNGRFLLQWWDMGRSTSVEMLRQVAARSMALPWVNTVAADRGGNALYADYSVVPNVSAAHLATCATSAQAQALAAARTYLLDGTRAACNWPVDAAAAAPGIMTAATLPALTRTDYVNNSNDSAWLANPAQLLTGFSPLVGEQARAQSLRTRVAFLQVQERLSGADGLGGNKVTSENLETVFFQNRVMAAELLRAPLVSLCTATPSATATNGTVVNLAPACAVLAGWNGRATIASTGTHVFREFWRRAQNTPGLFATPFSATSPITTPRDPAVGNPTVAAALLRALADGVLALNTAGVSLTSRLGDVQFVTRSGTNLPLDGGDEFEGVYNKITPPGLVSGGYTSVISGSSYIQLVAFEANGVNARGLLTYSQSANGASPYFADQTRVLSTSRFVKLPFTEAEIAADPGVTAKLVLVVK
jgi:acyl-homoserine-lactone acylase